MKVQGNLRISIDVDGHLGILEINHDIIQGMDFGVEWDLSLRFRAKQWKYGEHGDSTSLLTMHRTLAQLS